MRYLPPAILHFAVLTVVYLFLAYLSDATQTIHDIYDKWNSGLAMWINGMGLVSNYVYLSDNEYNLVRVDARMFSHYFYGTKVEASLNLNTAKVFSFRQHVPNLHLPGYKAPTEKSPMTVFFIEGDSESLIRKDSLCILVIKNEDKQSNQDGLFPVELTVVSLDDLSSKQVYFARIRLYQSEVRLLSAGKIPVIFYDQESDLRPIWFEPRSGSVDKVSIEYGDDHPSGFLRLKRSAYSFTGGFYLNQTKQAVLHTKNHTLNVLDSEGHNYPIPYSAFFVLTLPRPQPQPKLLPAPTAAPLPMPSPPPVTPTSWFDAITRDINSLTISAVVGLVALALLFYFVYYGKTKKERRRQRQQKAAPRNINKRAKKDKAGGRGNISLASSVMAGSSFASSSAASTNSSTSSAAISTGSSSAESSTSASSAPPPPPRTSPKAGKKKKKPWDPY